MCLELIQMAKTQVCCVNGQLLDDETLGHKIAARWAIKIHGCSCCCSCSCCCIVEVLLLRAPVQMCAL